MRKAHKLSGWGVALCGIRVVDQPRKAIVTCTMCRSIEAGRAKVNDGRVENHLLPSRAAFLERLPA